MPKPAALRINGAKNNAHAVKAIVEMTSHALWELPVANLDRTNSPYIGTQAKAAPLSFLPVILFNLSPKKRETKKYEIRLASDKNIVLNNDKISNKNIKPPKILTFPVFG